MNQRGLRPLVLTVPGLLLQLVGVFLLPFIVGIAAAAVFDASEVVDTVPALTAFTLLLLTPITVAQVLGLLLKSSRDLRFHSRQGSLTLTRLFDVLYDHIRVITSRGWSMLGISLLLITLSMAFGWASMGMLAVLGLLLFYAVVGWTIVTSTFFVGSFERGLGRSHSGIERTVQPGVCLAGADAEEVFVFRRVPVPWGYSLLIEDTLPPRLGGESRYVVNGAARDSEIERRGRIRRTPRGVHRLGPARLWYQDVLGITRVSVASAAKADLKVLPTIRPVQIIDPPRTSHQTPDVKTRPHRFPTEDYFRFRDYHPGDDTRRIHWKLSMRTGAMQVRLPETREITKQDVLILIDSFVPQRRLADARGGAEELLDQVVESALGLTRTLVDRGDRVRLVAVARTPDLKGFGIESLTARKGTATRWQDLGARMEWQSQTDLPELLEGLGDKGHAIVVTARFSATPPTPDGLQTTWVFMDPKTAFANEEPHWLPSLLARPAGMWSAVFTRPHPVGSDDNTIGRRITLGWQARQRWAARRNLRQLATRRMGRTAAELAGRGDAVYRIEHTPTVVRIRGLSGGPGALS